MTIYTITSSSQVDTNVRKMMVKSATTNLLIKRSDSLQLLRWLY